MRLHPITVDDREQRPGAANTQDHAAEKWVADLKAEGASANVGRLDAGDYQWVVEPEDEGEWLTVVVERKGLGDLIASVSDERLYRFIEGTGGSCSSPTLLRALLVEGDTRFGHDVHHGRSWTTEQIDNLLAGIQEYGVTVIRSAGPGTSAKRLASFWRWTGKESRAGSVLRIARPEISSRFDMSGKRDQIRMLMCLPGWGETRAQAAIAHFGSISAVLAGLDDAKAWKEVKGIGSGMVKNAREMINGN